MISSPRPSPNSCNTRRHATAYLPQLNGFPAPFATWRFVSSTTPWGFLQITDNGTVANLPEGSKPPWNRCLLTGACCHMHHWFCVAAHTNIKGRRPSTSRSHCFFRKSPELQRFPQAQRLSEFKSLAVNQVPPDKSFLRH